jgi:hypothetical protein
MQGERRRAVQQPARAFDLAFAAGEFWKLAARPWAKSSTHLRAWAIAMQCLAP